MANYGQHFSTLQTPQGEKARADQVENSAGGFVFALDKWARLDRWLILGCDGGTYYATERKLARENAQTVLECLAEDGARTVARIAEVSDAGRAPKNDPAIFALAMAAGGSATETRKAALAALPRVCRIGTHLFHFARDVEHFRRWGRSLRNAIAGWYNDRPADKLALDVVKYQSRDGWSHRDLLRLAHVQTQDAEHQAIYRYATCGSENLGERAVKRRKLDKSEALVGYGGVGELPRIIRGFELAKGETDHRKVAKLVAEYGLTREMIPTVSLNSAEVWEALLEKMPMEAMTRNLGKMTAVGLIQPLSDAAKRVAERLRDSLAIKKARLHPLKLLVALKTYQRGHGDKGKLEWSPDRSVVDALDEGFYLAFEAIEPTGKNIMIALDVSGSMGGGQTCGACVTPRVGSSAMAMATARSEKNYLIAAFTSGLSIIDLSPRSRLDDICRTTERMPFGGTDCALPMVVATQMKLPVDAFQVYTDNETWAGNIHPFQALRDYRQSSGRAAKLCVVGMTSTGFSIADPSDAGMLDFVGMDTSAPAVMADFARQ